MRTSNPASVQRGFGGAARNVAENLARLGVDVALCSAVGDDETGRAILRHLDEIGCDARGVRLVEGAPTAQYAAIIAPDGELVAGASDAGALDAIEPADVEKWTPLLEDAAWLVLDCNLPTQVLRTLIERRRCAPWRLAVNGTSIAKVQRLPQDLSAVDLLFVNEQEARAVGERGAQATAISRGAGGVQVCVGEHRWDIPAPRVRLVVDVTGGGDALLAATLRALIDGLTLDQATARAMELAARTVQAPTAVP